MVDENKSKSVKRGNKLKKRNIKMTTTEEDHTQLLIGKVVMLEKLSKVADRQMIYSFFF